MAILDLAPYVPASPARIHTLAHQLPGSCAGKPVPASTRPNRKNLGKAAVVVTAVLVAAVLTCVRTGSCSRDAAAYLTLAWCVTRVFRDEASILVDSF